MKFVYDHTLKRKERKIKNIRERERERIEQPHNHCLLCIAI